MSVKLSAGFILESCRASRAAFRSWALLSGDNLSQLRRSGVGKMATNGVNGVHGTRSKHDIAALKVNQSRLLDAIHTGCEFGAAHRYGE
jgi:hypothetical protein